MARPDDDPVTRTRRAYDGAADAFQARTSDRSRIEPYAERFAAQVAPGGLVLDLGCGPGHDRPLLVRRGLRVVGMDLSSSMLDIARREHPGAYVRGDLRRVPFRGPVGGIWANAALLHVPRADAAAVLGALVELLAPGAPIFVSLKLGGGEGIEELPAYEGMAPRWFTYWEPDQLDDALRSAGLRIVHAVHRSTDDNEWLVRIAVR